MTPGHLHFRSRLRQVAARVLPGALIVVLAAFGLLMMHGIGSHGAPGGHALAHQGMATAGTHGHDATPDPAARALPGFSEHSDGGGLAMAVACVFVLLLMARHLLPPRQIVRIEHALRQGWAWFGVVAVVTRRPPSLLALGISRT